MTCSIQYTAVLTRHPETYSQAAYGIEAGASLTDAGGLVLHYALKGDIVRLRIPPPRSPRRSDRLWEHTCFEAFIRPAGETPYYEFNFSPSREWAACYFRDYRDGQPFPNEDATPNIIARTADDRLDLDATIHLHRLPMVAQNGSVRLGLSAVIEEENGRLSYWALKHPPGKPDFHHPDAFALEIERTDMEIVNQRKMEKR